MVSKYLSPLDNCKKKIFIDFGNFPILNFPINYKYFKRLTKKKNFQQSMKLQITISKKYGYLCLKKKVNSKLLDNLYKKFYRYPSAILNQIEPTRDKIFLQKLYKSVNLKKINKVLEIGCYDGYILHRIKKKFLKIQTFGCEPSPGADIANKFGLNVKKTYFDHKTYPNQKFDLIILRHTLEHISNINKTINNIRKVMNNNSILAIEVPNINFYLKNGLLEVFSFQHIHYFSMQTFFAICKSYNFKILRKFETPENIIIIIKKNNSKNKIENKITKKFYSDVFLNKLNINLKKIKLILSKYKHNEIALWGAGGFAVAAINLYKIPISRDTIIVDKDKTKHGLSFSNHENKILKINKNTIKSKKLIVITSYYTKQIIKEIKRLNININVMQIFPSISLKKINK